MQCLARSHFLLARKCNCNSLSVCLSVSLSFHTFFTGQRDKEREIKRKREREREIKRKRERDEEVERDEEEERERETKRERESEKVGERDKKREGERDVELLFKRNDGCLGTLWLSSILYAL